MERFRASYKATSLITGREVYGSTPPSVIVGESRYPKVPVLYHVPPGVLGEEAKDYDNPPEWWGRLELNDIISRRAYQVASIVRVDVRDFTKLYETEISLASVSVRPVDTESLLKKPPNPRLTFRAGIDPIGPSAEAERILVKGNASLPRRLENLVWDDVKAEVGILELYRDGVDIYTIIRALSLGLLGELRSRKLVPTRWAITATDTVLSNHMLRDVWTYPSINTVELYRGEYLSNRFFILLYPGRYFAEWLEVWFPLTAYTKTAREPVIIYNRDVGVGKTLTPDGGFEAARFSLIEALWRRGRRASALIVREILPSYYAGVGNWHIRETVRMALQEAPVRFGSVREALEFMRMELKRETSEALTKTIAAGKYRKLTEYTKTGREGST